MGTSPSEALHLWFDQAGGAYVSYGLRQSWCYFVEMRTTKSEASLWAMPDDGSSWSARLRMPLHPDYGDPVGVWAVYAQDNDGKRKSGDWMLLEEGGTGYCGWDALDVSSSTVEELREKGTPCTWHVTPVEGGYLLVLDYEGGQSVIAVTL